MTAPPSKRPRWEGGVVGTSAPAATSWGAMGGADAGEPAPPLTVAMVMEKGRFAAACFDHDTEGVTLFSVAASESDQLWMVQGLQQALPTASRVTFLVL